MSNTCVRCAYAKERKKMDSRKQGIRTDSNTSETICFIYVRGETNYFECVYSRQE